MRTKGKIRQFEGWGKEELRSDYNGAVNIVLESSGFRAVTDWQKPSRGRGDEDLQHAISCWNLVEEHGGDTKRLRAFLKAFSKWYAKDHNEDAEYDMEEAWEALRKED